MLHYLIRYKTKLMKDKNMKSKKLKQTIFIIVLIIIVSITVFKISSSANKKEYNKTSNQIINNITNELNNNTENTIINEISNKITNEVNNTVNNITSDIENEIQTDTESNNKVENDNEFDSTVAFIGDSRTQGFIMYNGLKEVQDYSYIGLMVDTAVTKKFVKTDDGNKITLLEDMKNKNIKKVYIMLGVNELGWSYPEVFKLKYGELIDSIREVKPDCKIYLQSIIPVTKSKSNSYDIYNNSKIAKYNEYIKEVAKDKNVNYLDVKSVMVDSEGNLPESASTDGIHIGKNYCEKWLEYLKRNS